jgi:hypothetical protein
MELAIAGKAEVLALIAKIVANKLLTEVTLFKVNGKVLL